MLTMRLEIMVVMGYVVGFVREIEFVPSIRERAFDFPRRVEHQPSRQWGTRVVHALDTVSTT